MALNKIVDGALSLNGNVSLGSVNGNPVDAVARTSASSTGYVGMPQIAISTSYILVASDAGKHIYFSGTTASQTITIPDNNSVAFQIGTALTFVNLSSVAVNIAITSDTMYLAGAATATTGVRALAIYGMATAIKVTSTTWIISGNGLT